MMSGGHAHRVVGVDALFAVADDLPLRNGAPAGFAFRLAESLPPSLELSQHSDSVIQLRP